MQPCSQRNVININNNNNHTTNKKVMFTPPPPPAPFKRQQQKCNNETTQIDEKYKNENEIKEKQHTFTEKRTNA